MQSLRKTPRQCRLFTFLLQRPHGIVELRLFTSRATRGFFDGLATDVIPRKMGPFRNPKPGRFESGKKRMELLRWAMGLTNWLVTGDITPKKSQL